jgi:hypothetical protein
MNTLKIGLIAGMLAASSMAFSSKIELDATSAQIKGCSISKSITGLPFTLKTKDVKWYDLDGITKRRSYYCHFKVPKKHRHLIDPGIEINDPRCSSEDAVYGGGNGNFIADVIVNKNKIAVVCRAFSEEYFPD